MTDVKRRIAAAERALERVRPRIHRITIVNSLDGLFEDDAGKWWNHILSNAGRDSRDVPGTRQQRCRGARARGYCISSWPAKAAVGHPKF